MTSNWRATHEATAAEVSAALKSWAPGVVNTSSTSSAEQSPLYVIVVGGGGTDYVWIDASSLAGL